MLGAPLDLAYTLPEDWKESVLSLRSSGAEACLVRYLQEIVQSAGDLSIGSRYVQDLALWATGVRRGSQPSFWPELRTTLETLFHAAGDSWPGDSPVAERLPHVKSKSIFELSQDLHSLLFEWFVLAEIVKRGVRPLRSEGPRGFDWIVDVNGAFGIEVKHKGLPGSVGRVLEWFWKGISLLPQGRFISNYQWHWHVQDTCRSRHAERVMDSLWGRRAEIEALLPGALAEARLSPWQLERSIGSELRLRASHFTSRPSVAIELRPEGNVLVDIQANDQPRVLVCHGGKGCYRADALGPSQTQRLVSALGALNLAHQASRRTLPGLYVVNWWIPHEWDGAVTREWLRDVCEHVASENRIQYLAIWPIGIFESRTLAWVANSQVERDHPRFM